MTVPGIGLLIATALIAAVGGMVAFRDGRHLAAWLGLTPRESSNGQRRHLGGISKRGDCYLRMLFIHSARSALACGRSPGEPHQEEAPDPTPALGGRSRRPGRSQQGYQRAGEQTGPHRLRRGSPRPHV